MRARVGRLFFDSAGRIGRGPFLAGIAVLAALFWGYEAVVRGAAHAWTAWLVDLVLVFSAACLLSKRLHDRGRAGWWAFVPLLAFAVVWPRPTGVLGWAGAAVLAATLVDLGLRPGEGGANRYGKPRRPA
jgi:uncharacterized membrane protein YhaH (DUF805 family)